MAIYDCTGAQISTGDFCEISGAYFKTDNGLYLVTASEGDPITTGRGLTLHKCGKSGKLRTSGGTVAFWPLSSYCSDPRKNAAARAHNKENAQIKRVTLPTWYAAEHFRNEAQEAAERVERYTRNGWNERDIEQATASRDFYAGIADRLSENAEKPKEKAPETGIKFYYNGIKVDGGKLIPCYMSIDGDTVHISAKDYGGILPVQYFTVIDESDSMTDYFEKERTTLDPSHPLYKFARYAALKCLMNGRTYRKPTPEQIKEWNTTKDPGQPTAADLAAVEEMKTAQESARLAAEHAAELAEREKVLNERNAGRSYIESVAQAHPLTDGAPYVVIEWSEHPAFYSWDDGQLVLSVAAAEIILKHYDEERHAENIRDGKGGYFKTKFTIHYTENGEDCTYEGRYDLGDNDGGLIAHIRAFAEGKRKPGMFHDEDASAIASGIWRSFPPMVCSLDVRKI